MPRKIPQRFESFCVAQHVNDIGHDINIENLKLNID